MIRLGIGALGAVAAVALGPVVGIAPSPIPMVVIGLFLGGLLWSVGWMTTPEGGPRWRRPQPPAEYARLHSDARTRRFALMLNRSNPGAAFETTSLAAILRELASQRLTERHDLPSDDSLDDADGLLTPQLLAHLRAESPPPLRTKTLHAYLKEIDQL